MDLDLAFRIDEPSALKEQSTTDQKYVWEVGALEQTYPIAFAISGG